MTVKRDIKSVSYEEAQDLAIKIKALPGNTQLCYCFLQGKEVFLAECYMVLDKLRETLTILENMTERLKETPLQDRRCNKCGARIVMAPKIYEPCYGDGVIFATLNDRYVRYECTCDGSPPIQDRQNWEYAVENEPIDWALEPSDETKTRRTAYDRKIKK